MRDEEQTLTIRHNGTVAKTDMQTRAAVEVLPQNSQNKKNTGSLKLLLICLSFYQPFALHKYNCIIVSILTKIFIISSCLIASIARDALRALRTK